MEHLSLRIGLAVADALQELVPAVPPISIKRPNDLLIAGKKVAGILCEARWEGPAPSWVVVGLGLNVANRLEDDLAGIATTLAGHGIETAPDSLAGPLSRVIADAALASGPLTPAEERRLLDREPPG
jgi:BirA family biotin operon repressor/biotin-[acetyl-CoA-carboxylase] ligase